MSRSNVIRLDKRLPYPAKPMRDAPLPPRQQRATLAGLRDEAVRGANWVEAQLRGDPARADMSLDAIMSRAYARQLQRVAVAIDDRVLQRSKQKSARSHSFKLPDFPPAARPEKGAQMAMDDAFAWAGGVVGIGAAIWSTFAEGLAFPGYAVLAEQAQRAEYRRFAEIISTEMTRKWIRLTSTSEDDDNEEAVAGEEEGEQTPYRSKITKTEKIAEIGKELDRLQAQDRIRRCIELDELFGRSHLYVDTGDTENRAELKTSLGDGKNEISRAKIKKNGIEALRAVEPVWIYPTNYTANDPLRDDWYNPQTWFVLGKEVHKTRLLMFVGREVPDLLKPAYSFGGLSMTQMARPYVDNWLRTRQSVADIIHAYSVFVLKTNVGAVALTDGGDLLMRRAELFNNLRDNRGLMMVDKETEDFTNVSANIGGLEGLQAQVQEHLCAVAGIPVVKYLGLQPTGLNNSDDGAIRIWYDWIAAQQEKRIRPNLSVIIDMIQLSLFGEVDPSIVYHFEPLREMDEKELAELRELDAKTDIAYADVGVLSPVEIRKKIASDPDSPYSSIDVDDVPDLPQEEAEGLDPSAVKGAHMGHAPKPMGGEGQPNPPKPSDAEQPGADPEVDKDESPFKGRVRQRAARHQQRVGDFYERADKHSQRKLDADYLRKKIEMRESDLGHDEGSFATLEPSPFAPEDPAKSTWEDNNPDSSAKDEFKETEHPRDDDGKFASGARGAGNAQPRAASTIAERKELRKQIKGESDTAKKTELKEKLADSYRYALEQARKAGNQEKIKKFQDKLQKIGAAHGEIQGTSTSSAHLEALTKGAREVARKRGFRDLSRISITDEREEFKLNGQTCLYAGSYNNSDGKIVLYASAATPETVERIIAHEVMHDKWNFVRRRYKVQNIELLGKAADTRDIRPNPWLKPDGSLGAEAKSSKKYAIYEAMHDAFFALRPEDLASTDGVTPYSREWWKAYANGESSLDNAVNETLAEMSMELHATGSVPKPSGHRWLSYREEYAGARIGEREEKKSHVAWDKLFKTVEKLYDKHYSHEGFGS